MKIHSNALSTWKEMFQEAKYHIIAISPYLDNTIVDLFEIQKQSTITKILITDINEDHLLKNTYQLDALLKLLKLGIECRRKENIHAKILIIDHYKRTTIGSQNFTKRGSEVNYEETVEFSTCDQEFKNRTDQLIAYTTMESQKINIEDIQNLLSLSKSISTKKPNIPTYKDILTSISESLTQRDKNTLDNSINNIIKSSQNDYKLNWHSDNRALTINDGQRLPYRAKEDKRNHLVFDFSSKRLGFVRMNSMRLSLVSIAVTYKEKYKELFNKTVSLEVGKRKTLTYNIIISLTNESKEKARLFLYFDTVDMKLIDIEDKLDILSDPTIRADIFNSNFTINTTKILEIITPFKWTKPVNYADMKMSEFTDNTIRAYTLYSSNLGGEELVCSRPPSLKKP